MDLNRSSTSSCPIGRALDLLGDAWSMMILRDAGYGLTRFEDFRSSLGIAPNILTRRLAALTDAGLLEKRRYSERPPRQHYLITDKGRDFLPILAAIGAWGARHCGGGPFSRTVDAETGAPIEAAVVDRATGRTLSDLAVRIVKPERDAAPAS